MYIPSMALELSGNVVVSAKDFVFALHKVLKFWTVGMINISTVIIYLQDQHNTKNVLKAQSCNSKFLFLSFQNARFYLLWSAPSVMFSFIIGLIWNERSTLHCEIKRFVITVLEVSKGEKLGRITCGRMDMNFAQKTLSKAQITSLCSRYYRISNWTDIRAISKDLLRAVLIGCLPDDQSATVFAKSCNWKFLLSPFQIGRFYLSFCSVLSYIKPIKSSRMRTHHANLMAKYSCSLLREKLNYLVQSDENTTSRRPSPSNKENPLWGGTGD